MTIQRSEIRGAIKGLLVAAETALGDRVFENRVRPFRHRQLPAASVYSRGETVEVNSEGPRLYNRRAEVYIQIVVDGEDDVDDQSDAIAEQVELAMETSRELLDVPGVADFELTRVDGPELDGDGRHVIGMVQLVYEVQYEREFADATGALEDFTGGNVDIESAASRPGAEAEGSFDVVTN